MIASFAAKSRAIVLVSDKALTYPGAGMQSDTSIKKILPLGPSNWHLLTAGDVGFAGDVAAHCSKALQTNPDTADDADALVQCVVESYKATRLKRVRATIFEPRFLTEAWMVDPATPHDDQFRAVWDEVSGFNCNCDLLICGFDKAGRAHMHSLDNPGVTSSLNAIGLHAIGSGWSFALGRLLWNEIDRDQPLEQVLYNAFDAKATAEIVQGVGYEWDAVILTATTATEVPKKIKDVIEKVYIRTTLDPFDMKMDAEDVPPQNWKSQLRKFCEGTLPPAPTTAPSR